MQFAASWQPCFRQLPPPPGQAHIRVSAKFKFLLLPPDRVLLLTCLLGAVTAQAADDTSAAAPAVDAPVLPGKTPAATLAPIDATIKRDATLDERRYSTASKIIVNREEIAQFGDSTAADVLKRLPGVSIGGRPGRGGEIRMRGMGGGYTQILLNGERMPQGFSLDSLTPDQIERIEISRAPTAESGARAIAGTINIVLRDAVPTHFDDLQLGMGAEQWRPQPTVSWTRNDTLGSLGSYNVTLSPFRSDQVDHNNTVRTVTALDSGQELDQTEEHSDSRSVRDGVHLTSRLRFPLADKDSLTLQPFVVYARGHSQTDTTLVDDVPGGRVPYAASTTAADTRTLFAKLNGQWQTQLSASTSLLLSASTSESQNDSHSLRLEDNAAGQQSRSLMTDNNTEDRTVSTKGKLSTKWVEGHALVGGWELEYNGRTQLSDTYENGLPQTGLAAIGDHLQIATRLLAGYAQDEWEPSKQWSTYAGLRWEAIETDSAATGYDAHNRSAIWTPLLHAVWRPDEKSNSQVRMSLTRSYKSPTFAQLTGLPVLSVQNNNADMPDHTGTPNLRPELATGIDIAFEYYLSGSSLLSASVFRRDIHDLIRTVTDLETVAWSASPRWVARPQNIGGAVTQGIELEAKIRLNEVLAGMPPVNLRANLSLYRSNVDGVPGPDNRIDQQPRASGNFGGDYRFAGTPLTLGGNLNWTPATVIQSTPLQASNTSLRLVADAYLLWVINPRSQLRFSANNWLPHDYTTGSSIDVPALNQRQDTQVLGATHTVVNVRWELKL